MMKERPILFSAPMVVAILEGTKTKTRRVCKPAEQHNLSFVVEVPDPREHGQVYNRSHFGDEEGGIQFACPYGKVGDQLWVRENHSIGSDIYGNHISASWLAEAPKNHMFGNSRVMHPNAPIGSESWCLIWKKRPSIHMPRWASRIQLEITDIRVERLNDISESDAVWEGFKGYGVDDIFTTARNWFRSLWETINGTGSWGKNPFVWVIEFKVIKP